MQYIAFLFRITCILNNEIHSSILALLKSKVHIHILIEEHIKLQVCRPPVTITHGEKGIKGEVEQPHAQLISSNPKTKPVHSISQVADNSCCIYHMSVQEYT